MTVPRTDAPTVRDLRTMLDVEHLIHRYRDALVDHPFIRRLEGEGTIEQFRRLLPRLAFFTLVFQDILRLARERCNDPQVAAIARGLELGDRGHDHWYLDDLQRMGICLDIRWMFSPDQAVARDVTYEIVSEVLRVNADSSRLSVTLSLEAIAGEFFGRVTQFADRLAIGPGLKYFGVPHLAAERNHDVFGDAGQRELAFMHISAEAAPEVRTAVKRTFAAMTRLADDLEAAMRNGHDDTRILRNERVGEA